MPLMSESRSFGPHIIGATGGSGTRVVAGIIRHGGMFIGTNLNASGDAIEFGGYSDRWINAFMAGQWRLPPPLDTQTEMIQDLNDVLERHLSPLGTAARPWGWKEPRSIYMLPFFHSQFPRLKFLHVVRDGRDMAYSPNQNQLIRHGSTLLGPTEENWSQPWRSIALWGRINLLAADYGETHLRGQYMRIRFEDLCAAPVPTICRVLEFFGLQSDAEDIAGLEVRSPTSIGRWRTQDRKTVAGLHRIGGPALLRFEYLDAPLGYLDRAAWSMRQWWGLGKSVPRR